MIIRKRKLARKSLLGVSKYANYTVDWMLECRKHKMLLSIYYTCSSIDFSEEILEELGIVGEWVIDKPGKDPDKLEEFIKGNPYMPYIHNTRVRGAGSDVMIRTREVMSKSYWRGRNQKKGV